MRTGSRVAIRDGGGADGVGAAGALDTGLGRERLAAAAADARANAPAVRLDAGERAPLGPRSTRSAISWARARREAKRCARPTAPDASAWRLPCVMWPVVLGHPEKKKRRRRDGRHHTRAPKKGSNEPKMLKKNRKVEKTRKHLTQRQDQSRTTGKKRRGCARGLSLACGQNARSACAR